MFDSLFKAIASVLSVFYDITGNFALSIAMLTLVVMIVTTPFTLKGTRSMIQMQRLQPEMRRIQLKYKDDRQKQNEELMAFYKENSLNPLGGCLPLLLQAPIFLILFRVIRGLTTLDGGTFQPKYLDHKSDLYQKLDVSHRMMSFGVDLAESASKSLQVGFTHGLPHVVLVAIVAVTSYYQQKQIQGRNPDAEIPPQQKMLMRIMPAMFVVFAFVAPSALVVYFVTSNLYRIGMQAYITRSLYHGEDSLGAQAQRAAAEAKKLKDEEGGPQLLPRLGKRVEEAKPKPAASSPAPTSTPSTNGTKKPSTPPVPRASSANRSKKKKKRR